MRDFFGEPIQIGDSVAVILKGHRKLTKATVISFTPRQVRVEYVYQSTIHTYLAYPDMVVKKPRK